MLGCNSDCRNWTQSRESDNSDSDEICLSEIGVIVAMRQFYVSSSVAMNLKLSLTCQNRKKKDKTWLVKSLYPQTQPRR